MDTDTLIAASLFALASYITPGPNNTMILSSGVRFGLRRSIPHLLGICLGFAFMLVAVGLGLHTLLHDHPTVLTAMRWIGAAWMLYLAWQLATSKGGAAAASGTEKPMSFLGASAFQWINPKAWVMAVTAMSTYLPADAGWQGTLQLAAAQTVVGSPCVLVWAGFGSALRDWLADPIEPVCGLCGATQVVFRERLQGAKRSRATARQGFATPQGPRKTTCPSGWAEIGRSAHQTPCMGTKPMRRGVGRPLIPIAAQRGPAETANRLSRLRIFNIAMALALVASLYPLVQT